MALGSWKVRVAAFRRGCFKEPFPCLTGSINLLNLLSESQWQSDSGVNRALWCEDVSNSGKTEWHARSLRWNRWPQYLNLWDTVRTVVKADLSAKVTAHWFRDPSMCLEIIITVGVTTFTCVLWDLGCSWEPSGLPADITCACDTLWWDSFVQCTQAYIMIFLLRELASPEGNATGIREENETWKIQFVGRYLQSLQDSHPK